MALCSLFFWAPLSFFWCQKVILKLHNFSIRGFFPLPFLPTFLLSGLSCLSFPTDWLSRLGLGNQVGSTTDHLPSAQKDWSTLKHQGIMLLRNCGSFARWTLKPGPFFSSQARPLLAAVAGLSSPSWTAWSRWPSSPIKSANRIGQLDPPTYEHL